MVNTLESVHPAHRDYPFDELRVIEENEGDEGES